MIDFARDVLGTPLDPWQEWAAIHLGELLPDGRPRFRVVLLIVPRQCGKTLLAKTLIQYWLFLDQVPTVLGTSTDRSYAKRAWAEVCEQAKANPLLAEHLGRNAVRLTISEESLTTLDGCEYRFAANNRRAGRSTTLHRWVCDELREHANWDAWNAATHAQNAVATAQTVCITNMGDDSSIVLDSLRDSALQFVETGDGDPRLGIFEWSAPAGSDPTDLNALAMANPALGRRIDPDALLGAATRAKRAGGEELAQFRTEVMCIRVDQLDPAIDPDAWLRASTATPVDLAQHRDKLALCVDVALDGTHASVVGAAMIDGKVHVEAVAAWDGYGCTKTLRAELPALVERLKPRVVGWYPNGPAAAVAAELEARKGNRAWPPRRVKVEELRAEQMATCMGLAEIVAAGQLSYPQAEPDEDDLLSDHVKAGQKLNRGDGWIFVRRGTGPIDALYGLAGAVHLARTLPPPPQPLVVL